VQFITEDFVFVKTTTTPIAAHAYENFFNMDSLRIVVIAIVYFCAYQLSSLFPDTQKILMGIGLAALLLNQRRLWLFPGILDLRTN